MFTTYVGFTAVTSNTGVTPPIVEGEPDGVWVTTRTANKEEISKAARKKIEACYGTDIKNIEVCDGMQWER